MAILKSCCVLPFLVIACFVAHSTTSSAARDFATLDSSDLVVVGAKGFPSKMKVGELQECWDALSEIKSCSNEIHGFLLNGKTDIEAPCCVAIMKITHNCWPAMLTTIGFSAEQANILRGYCDAAKVPSPTPSVQHII